MEMRAVFAEKLLKIMQENDKVVVLDADLAKASGTIGLRNHFPDRAFDVGIAEQNMVSIAAGMSSYGMIPFVSSFTPFATRRVLDQITLSCLYAKQNVKIVGTDPGISAEVNGGTHMSFEDIGALRSVPGIVIFEPVDATQLAQSLDQIIDYNGTMYIRMWRKTAEDVFDKNYKFDLFKADTIKEGTDITIFATGFMVSQAIKAEKELAKCGINAEIINIHTIKPIDRESVIASAKKTNAVLVCENHNYIGGLYSAVSEVLSKEYPVKMDYVAVEDRFGEVGYLPYLIKALHLDVDTICKKAKALLNK